MRWMHYGCTYDEGDHAVNGSGITLSASEPSSPNAFVQIPVDEARPQQSMAFAPVSRQKKMRVPRGGSVERPQQRNPRKLARPVQVEEVAPAPIAPSLHIFLEQEPEERFAPPEEEPESLAQFVASFPRIPDGLIFQGDEDEALPQEAATPSSDLPEDDPEADLMTMRFDQEDEPDPHPAPRRHGGVAGAARGAQRAQASSERVMPAVNPRFEKLIREATSSHASERDSARARARTGAAASEGMDRMRTQAISGPVGRMSGSPGASMRHGMHPKSAGRVADPMHEPFGRASGPLPLQRQRKAGYAAPAAKMAAGAIAAAGQRNPSIRLQGSAPARSWGGPVAGMKRDGGSPASAAPSMRPTQHPASHIPSPASPAHPASAPSPAPSASERTPAISADLGKPLLDASAIEESTIFDEPPISIAEGMKDAEKSHKKGRTFLLIGLVVVVMGLIGVFAFMGGRGDIVIPEISITTTNPSSSGKTDAGGGASDGAGPTQEPVAGGESAASGAGSVTYRYTAKTPSGVEYSVEESTTFDSEGKCTFTTMKMEFPSEQAAKDYTDSVARDLGSKYTLDSMNGANATITIDNSGLGLDREDYENALRYSVEDLVILKK